MAPILTTENMINGVPCRRVRFGDVKIGDVLHHAERGLLGTVETLETFHDSSTARRIVLDNGKVLTYKGYCSTRLWREIN